MSGGAGPLPTPALSARQRATVPSDRRTPRRGRAGGGYDRPDPMTLAPGLETEMARYPGASFDGQIIRDRRPFYHVSQYRPAGDSWVNWTAAGPPRAELHMQTAQWRAMRGTTNSRFPFVPGSPTGGMHTMIPSGPGSQRMTQPRYVDSGLPQMTYARVDRLSPSRYRGQSYSATTAVQGGRR